MDTTSLRFNELDPGDFERLGVQHQECRLTVIRRAASRAALTVAQTNARRAASQPQGSPETNQGLTQELSLVAASAYRLLDPRRRADATERAHVGRILPGALLAAGHTKFHSTPFANDVFDTTDDDIAAPVLIGDTAITETVPHHEPWSTVLTNNAAELSEQICTRDLIRHYESMIPLERIRRWVHQPQMIIGLIVALLLTSVWLVFWRQRETSRVLNSTLAKQTQTRPSAVTVIPSATISLDASPASIQHPIQKLKPEAPVITEPSVDTSTAHELRTVHSSRLRSDWTLLIQNKVSPSDSASVPPPIVETVPVTPQNSATLRVPAFSTELSEATRKRLLRELLPMDYLETLNDVNAVQIAGDRFLESSSKGTIEHWSGEIIAASPAWFSGNISELHRRWLAVSEVYDVDFAQFIVMTYIEATALPCSTTLNDSVISHSLEAVQFILADDTLDACEELIRFSRNQSDDVQQWNHLSEAIKLAKRTSTRVADRSPIDAATSSEATIIGRHLCFLSRDWSEGLPWLARCSDARLMGMAKNELRLTESKLSSATDWAEASRIWQGFSEGLTGYSQQVVQLHAVEILSQAISLASPIDELRLTEELEKLQSELPKSLLVANDWSKRFEFQKAEKSVEEIQLPPVSMLALPEPHPRHMEPIFLSGQVCMADGVDQLLSLRYQTGTVIGPIKLATIQRHSRSLFSPLHLDVSGTFTEHQGGTVVISTHVSSQSLRQTVYLDGEKIEIDPLEGIARCSVPKGEHTVRWVVDGVNFETLFLSLER